MSGVRRFTCSVLIGLSLAIVAGTGEAKFVGGGTEPPHTWEPEPDPPPECVCSNDVETMQGWTQQCFCLLGCCNSDSYGELSVEQHLQCAATFFSCLGESPCVGGNDCPDPPPPPPDRIWELIAECAEELADSNDPLAGDPFYNCIAMGDCLRDKNADPIDVRAVYDGCDELYPQEEIRS